MREADYQERAVLPAVHSTPAPDWGDPAQNSQLGTPGQLQPSTHLPALGHWAGDDLGWPGVHWLILNRQKCVWLTFVLLMFHSVVFFSYHGNFNITTKHLLFLSEPSLLSCPVGYFGRQGLFFSSGGVPISYQIPPPVFPVLRRFSLCEHCVSTHGKKKKKRSFNGNCSIFSTVRDINVISHN